MIWCVCIHLYILRSMHLMSFEPFVMALFKMALKFVICYFLIVSSLEESFVVVIFFNKYFLHLWHFMIFARLKQKPKQTQQINDKTQARKKKVKPENDIYVRVFCTLSCFCSVVFFLVSLYDERHRIIAHSLTVYVMCVYVFFSTFFFLLFVVSFC